MPNDIFADFNKTRIIFNATEIPINKPHHKNAHSSTFSSYKKNTLKVMVGFTPHDNVSYILNAYCGSASVRQIIERSDFWKDKEEGQDHDSMMAYRGIILGCPWHLVFER